MAQFTLVIGNRNYSSWSLRAGLAIRRTAADFQELVVPLDRPETAAALAEHSPSKRVPCLLTPAGPVWKSLAIVEYLAERFPEARLWPADADSRAHARAVSAEMHAGFAPLRTHLPMDLRSRHPRRDDAPGVAADVARIVAIWRDCRARFGTGGPFLYGAFTAADAMYAPVVGRFLGYTVALPDDARAYAEAVWDFQDMRDWRALAEAEPWVIDNP